MPTRRRGGGAGKTSRVHPRSGRSGDRGQPRPFFGRAVLPRGRSAGHYPQKERGPDFWSGPFREQIRCGAAASRPLAHTVHCAAHPNNASNLPAPARPASPQNWGQTQPRVPEPRGSRWGGKIRWSTDSAVRGFRLLTGGTAHQAGVSLPAGRPRPPAADFSVFHRRPQRRARLAIGKGRLRHGPTRAPIQRRLNRRPPPGWRPSLPPWRCSGRGRRSAAVLTWSAAGQTFAHYDDASL